jgi:hypothetical protein
MLIRKFVVIIFIIVFGIQQKGLSQVPCSGFPQTNTLITSSALVCSGSSVNLGFSNTNTLTGLVYTWYTSTVSPVGPWTSFASTYITNSVVSSGVILPTWFSVVITCTNGNLSNTIPAVSVQVATNSMTINSPTICSGQITTLTANSAGIINWYNSSTSTLSIGSSSTFVTPTLSAGNYTYFAEATNACTFAPFRFPTTVNVRVTPTISVNSVTLCGSQNSHTIIPSGANTYTYSSGSSLVVTSVTAVYTVSGTNSVGCISTSTLQVSKLNLPTPTLSINSGSICPNNTFTILPSGALTYSVQGGSFIVNPNLSTTYTVIGFDANGCSATAMSTVFVLAAPIITLNNSTICIGQTYTMYPSGAITYTYLNGGPIVTPISTSNYSLIGTNSNGCVSSNPKIVTVTVNTLTPNVTVNSGSICLGNTFFLTPSGADTYTYSSISNWVNPTITTLYVVTGRFLNSVCTASAISTVVVYSPTLTVITNPSLICAGATSSITVSGAVSYTWNGLNLGNFSIVSPTTTTNYSISGIDADGCFSNTVVTISVQECLNNPKNLINNNILSVYPNPNDGLFTLLTSQMIEIKIFNSLAQLVFKANLNEAINQFNLKVLPDGIYFIEFLDTNQRQRIKMIKD